jgi:prepilin-type N-terminal cleavage/methylation domain-containing protein
MRVDRRGFTVVELLAALTVSLLIVAGARGLLAALHDSGSRTQRRASAHDTSQAGLLLLRDLFANASASGDTARVFVGASRAVRFDSWCDSPYGGSERCRVEVAIPESLNGAALSMRSGVEAPISVPMASAPVALIYLERSSSTARWLSEWGRSLHAPAAVGVLLRSDTLVFGVGRVP